MVFTSPEPAIGRHGRARLEFTEDGAVGLARSRRRTLRRPQCGMPTMMMSLRRAPPLIDLFPGPGPWPRRIQAKALVVPEARAGSARSPRSISFLRDEREN